MSKIGKAAEEARKEILLIASTHGLTGAEFTAYCQAVIDGMADATINSSFMSHSSPGSPLPFPTRDEELASLQVRVKALEDVVARHDSYLRRVT